MEIEPQESASSAPIVPKAVKDPTHPHASPYSGVIPPPEHRFKPGNNANPGGRPKGADVGAAILRRLAKNPDADGIGAEARALADTLIDVSLGRADPKAIDSKIALEILDRASGPVVKESIQQNTHIVQGIELHDRGAPVPIPGSTT